MSLPRSLYKSDKQIGEGAFGKVYAAVRKSDGLQVAVKEVSKSKMTARCEEVPLEVVILQQVRDIPGLATIQDWHETQDTFYIVMERHKGQDLFDYISSQGSLTEPFSRNIFSKVRSDISPDKSASGPSLDIGGRHQLLPGGHPARRHQGRERHHRPQHWGRHYYRLWVEFSAAERGLQ